MDAKRRSVGLRSGYDFSNSLQHDKRFKFGHRDSNMIALDLSLANLFQKLTVECSGILGNPQWKHFRHMELLKKDQIRLSNGIWRSWHMQFQKGLKPLFCTFEINPQVDMLSHLEPQGAVIEGKYWKRTREAVAMEYRKWRLFHMQKRNWSNIRRMPSTAPSAFGLNSAIAMQQDETQQMQVDLTDNRLNQIFSALEDFPDTLFDIPRPGEERAYMRPLVDTVDLLQPNLVMLNPTLDELRFEPMEVIFSSLTSGGVSMPQVRPSLPSIYQQPLSQTNGEHRNAYFMQDQHLQQTPSNTAQYGNQTSPFLVPSPSKPVNIDTGGMGFPRVQDSDLYSVSPTAFLNLPQNARGRSQSEAMDLGTSPVHSNMTMKTEMTTGMQCSRQFESSPYQQQIPLQNRTAHNAQPLYQPGMQQAPVTHQKTHTQNQQQEKIDSLISQFMLESSENMPSQVPSNTSPGNTPTLQSQSVYGFSNIGDQRSSYGTLPDQPLITTSLQQGFGIHETSSSVTTPTLSQSLLEEAGSEKTEMEMQLIAEHMKKLEEEQLQQLREIEQQQALASQQYLHLLQQYVSQSGEQPSPQQQQILTSVLSDPSTVTILKAILLQGGGRVTSMTGLGGVAPITGSLIGGGGVTPPPSTNIKKENISPPNLSFPLQPPIQPSLSSTSSIDNSSLSNLISPTQLAKAAGVSDFQSRLIMAAAAQATNTGSSVVTSSQSFTPIRPHSTSPVTPSPQLKSPDSDPSLSPTPALLKKFKNARNLTAEEKKVYQELRRQSHITAEQRRRGSIKNGFDHLQSLVINPSQFPSGKISKATILEKTIDHIHQQHNERDAREKRVNRLKEELKELNEAIVLCQQQLPASGAPVTRQRFEENRQYFREYVQQRTQHNYKFWIYSIIIQQLFDSYNSMVSTGGTEELCQTVLTWFEQNCNLPALRPIVMSSLRELSMKTTILSDPSKVPQQLTDYATTNT